MAWEQLRERAVSTTLAALAATLILTRWVDATPLWLWFAVVVAFNVARLASSAWYRRGRADAEVLAALPRLVVVNVVPAALWGALVVATGFSRAFEVHMVMLIFIAGMMAAGVQSAASTPKQQQASVLLSIGVVSVFEALSGERALQAMALSNVGYVLALRTSSQRASATLRESLALRFENLDLLEQVKGERERELEARRAAEAASAEKTRFVAAVSHDVRQPLHAMGLFLSTLKQEPLPQKSGGLVESIERAHGSLVSLHDALLEASVLESGQTTPRLARVELRTVLETLRDEAAPVAKARGLELRVHAPSLQVTADGDWVLRILRNLVSNALAYTAKGGVLVSARRRGARVLVQVWDTGPGIPASERERIFLELHRLEGARAVKGTGLGLSIVKRLATGLGTEVSVHSKEGRGSVFSFTLPLAPVSAAPKGEGRVAVVVDDDASARQALSSVLERWGFEVIATQGSAEATAALAELGEVAVVVADLELCGESGAELLRTVQRQRPTALRVLMTGNAVEDLGALARDVGAVALRKPVSEAHLEAALAAPAR